MRGNWRASLASVLVLGLATGVGSAGTVRVPEDAARVTDALAVAAAGDTVRVGPGIYSTGSNGEAFPLTLATNNVVLLGAGADVTTLDAGTLSTVLVLQAAGLRVSGFTITGGWADEGGGIRVDSGSPQIDHNLLLENHAKLAGAGIYVKPGTAPWIHHNVIWRSMDTDIDAFGDPHGVQYLSANGVFEHNLIGRGDSNGLITTGTAKPVVRNNIFYQNGTPGLRGRGFCALSDTTESITHNVFYGNVIAALIVLTPGGPVNVSAGEANAYSLTDFIHSNLDADPLLVDPDHGNWHLSPGSAAIDAGDVAAGLDPDGTAPDAGPFYFDQNGVGAPVLPTAAALLPSVPNPFRGAATLPFTLARAGRVRLEIFDLRGRKLATLIDGLREPGPQAARWDGKDELGRAMAAGVYVVKLSGDGVDGSRRIVLVR